MQDTCRETALIVVEVVSVTGILNLWQQIHDIYTKIQAYWQVTVVPQNWFTQAESWTFWY